MGGGSSKIALGHVMVVSNNSVDESDMIDEFRNRNGVHVEGVELGPDTIPVEVQEPDSMEKRKNAWSEAVKKVISDPGAAIVGIQIDCRFHQAIGDHFTHELAFQSLREVKTYNRAGIDIHFINVSDDQWRDISEFIKFFNNGNKLSKTQFSFKVSHLFQLKN